MTKHGFRSALAVMFTLLFAAAGHADDEEKSGARDGAGNVGREGGEPSVYPSEADFALRSDDAAALAPAAAQGFSVSSGRQMELFGRLGLSSVNVTAEDSFGITAGMASDMASLSASRRVSEFGWGVGARLMSGSWGIEGTYNVFDSLALSPGWLVADETAAGELTTELLDLPVVASKADVLVGQVVRAVPLTSTMELFLGLGAGWMRATDSSTDRLLAGTGFPDPAEITGELPPDVPPELVASFVPEVEFNANRSSVVFAGSLGLSFRAGRILLRPRLDVVIARALTTELTMSFPGLADLGLPETDDLGLPGFSYSTSVTPRIYLLSVDVGLSN